VKPTRQNREVEGTLRELRKANSDGLMVGFLISTTVYGLALGFMYVFGLIVVP
jgi:hypothetical protein